MRLFSTNPRTQLYPDAKKQAAEQIFNKEEFRERIYTLVKQSMDEERTAKTAIQGD